MVELQNEYPEIARQCTMRDKFMDFDGSTGFHLTDDLEWIYKAQRILNYSKSRKNK